MIIMTQTVQKQKQEDLPLSCVGLNYLQNCVFWRQNKSGPWKGPELRHIFFPRRKRQVEHLNTPVDLDFIPINTKQHLSFGPCGRTCLFLRSSLSLEAILAVWPAINTNNFSTAWDRCLVCSECCVRRKQISALQGELCWPRNSL